MNASSIVLIVLAAIARFAARLVDGLDNKLVGWRNRFISAFAQIDVLFMRRYDLITHLVEKTRDNAKHELGTLDSKAELLGAIADMLDCPFPPFAQIAGS